MIPIKRIREKKSEGERVRASTTRTKKVETIAIYDNHHFVRNNSLVKALFLYKTQTEKKEKNNI